MKRSPFADCSRRTTSAGAIVTSRGAPTLSGSCRSSSSKRATGNLPQIMRLVRATSRLSTGSRYPSTISRLPGSRSIAVSSTSRVRRRCGRSTSRNGTSGFIRPTTWPLSGSSHCGEEIASTGAEWLGRAHSSALELGWYEPANRPWTEDYVEALARARADRRGRGSPRQMGGRRAAAHSNEDPRAGSSLPGSDRRRSRSDR